MGQLNVKNILKVKLELFTLNEIPIFRQTGLQLVTSPQLYDKC